MCCPMGVIGDHLFLSGRGGVKTGCSCPFRGISIVSFRWAARGSYNRHWARYCLLLTSSSQPAPAFPFFPFTSWVERVTGGLLFSPQASWHPALSASPPSLLPEQNKSQTGSLWIPGLEFQNSSISPHSLEFLCQGLHQNLEKWEVGCSTSPLFKVSQNVFRVTI